MKIDKSIQKQFAQYLTNAEVSSYMTLLFSDSENSQLSILDPGAGTGILGISLHKRYGDQSHTTFVELEDQMYQRLLKKAPQEIINEQKFEILNRDFIELSLRWRFEGKKFDRIIMNPPYYKLNNRATTSNALKNLNIHAPNIYVAFMWLALEILRKGGEMVAIVPRSFCNGLYFSKFRKYIEYSHSIEHIHVFNARNKVFSTDNVLQENIIIKIKRKEQSSHIGISYSNDHSFRDISTHRYTAETILNIGRNQFIRIPLQGSVPDLDELTLERDDTDIAVSTGPIVDFRLKENISLHKAPQFFVPILYPVNMSGKKISWPRNDIKKYGQYYKPTTETPDKDKNILPLNGYYVVVRRISSKEEKRRIVASVVSPREFESNFITFENHLNYYHRNKMGLEENEAKGLCVYLSTIEVDNYFQSISGSTQVNVTDLRSIPLPSKNTLRNLAKHYETTRENYLMSDLI